MNGRLPSHPFASKETTLYDLPDEIILLILQNLRPELPLTTFPPRHPSSSSYTDLLQQWVKYTPPPWPISIVPRSLYAFQLVSKRAKELVTPLLFNAITLQTIDVTYRLSHHLEQSPRDGLLVKHLLIPHDGLMHSPSGLTVAKEEWNASWRKILESASRLESLYLFTKPGGKALQELSDYSSHQSNGLSRLRRLTIGSLSYSVPFMAPGILDVPCLSHLHLIQWVPPTLYETFGRCIYQSLTSLRLSRLSTASIKLLVSITEENKGIWGAKDVFSQSSIVQHPLLLLLKECIEVSVDLQVVLLEFHELATLDMPEDLMPWDNHIHAAVVEEEEPPFEDVILRPVKGSEGRTNYWSTIRKAKSLLTRCSTEIRGSHLPPIDFRIVAPRTGGWDRNETLVDFHANAAACRGEVDRSSLMDEDVFELVDKYPHIGYDYAYDQSRKRVAYWTGALPKGDRKASEGDSVM